MLNFIWKKCTYLSSSWPLFKFLVVFKLTWLLNLVNCWAFTEKNPSDLKLLSLFFSLFLCATSWFHGKEVNLFMRDNYLSGNPLKQLAIVLFCGKRNHLSGVYLTSLRDKKATREGAIHSTPSHSDFLCSSRFLIECFWWECGFWQEVAGGI